MAALLQSESRSLYSWWWDSHISPKNSKWLQENLTDIDSKVKAMIKLIEEDADSFARRAEMYYKKRPELIKLVEEFYRAYRALAERYDHATGELRQAQRTMAEAFPNHIPLALSEDSPSCAYEAGPHTPEMPHPIRSLLDSDDIPIDSFGLSCNFHSFEKNGPCSEESELNMGKKELKQFSELFGEGRVCQGLNFQDGEKNDSNLKSDRKDEEEKDKKIRDFQEALSKLSGENQNLSSQILAETKRADTAQKEVGKLHESIGILKAEKEASLCQYHQSLEMIRDLERDISHAIEDMKRLNSEILEKDTKVKDAEEKCDFLERINQSLQLGVESLAKKLEMQEKIILERQNELEKLHTCMKEKQLHLTESNAALQSLRHMQGEYEEERRDVALKLQDGIEKLEEIDSAKKILEEEVAQLKAERQSSNKQKISLCLLVQNLHEKISDLEDAKQVLEEKFRLLLDKQSASLQELFCVKGEIQNLHKEHQNLIEQIESVGLNVDNIHSSVRDLQNENVQLKDICLREKDEKSVLLGKLGDMEKLAETNFLLKNSLSDANIELEGLRKKVTNLDQTIQAIQEEKSCILAEKIMLVSQVETILNNTENLSNNNAHLESRLSDMAMEFNSLDIKSRNLEESCLSLKDANSNLLMERKTMLSLIASIQLNLEDLNRRVLELETKHSCMENEKKLALHHLSEVEVLLNQEKEAHETFVRLNESRMANLENQIHHLQEAANLNKKEIEEEQENVFTAHIEIFMLQSCIAEMREKNFWLKDENQKCIEELKDAQKLLYGMNQENCEHKKNLKLLLDYNMKLRTDICQLLNSLDTEAGGIHQMEDNLSLHQILQTSEQLHNSLLYAEEKILQLNFERSVNTSLLQQITLEASDLVAEKEFLEQNFETRTEELNLLESEKHQLMEMNKQLKEELDVVYCQQEILKSEMDILSVQLFEIREAYHTQSHNNSELLEENRAWKKEFCFLRDDRYILEEEYDVVLKEALALDCFSFVLKHFTSEKDSELKNLCGKLDHLGVINHDLVKEVNVVNEKLTKVDMENWHLKESVEKLNGYKNHTIVLEDELVRVQHKNEELSHGLEDGKRSLFEKEAELLKLYQKFEVKERENSELDRENELLQNQLVVAKLTSENLEKKISFLSEDKIQQNDQIMHLHQENGKLEREIKQLQIALKEQETQEKYLKSELQKRFLEDEMGEMELEKLYSDLQIYIASAAIYGETTYKFVGEFEKEIEKFETRGEFLESELERRFGESELWENEAASLYMDLHLSCVRAAIFEEKTYELIKRYENLEAFSRLQSKKAGNEIAARDADYEELRKKLDGLEEEKERLGCQLTADLPLLLSLWDSISALEVQVLSSPMIAESCDQELQGSSSTSHQHGKIIAVSQDPYVSGSAWVSELCNYKTKVQAVTQALMESKRLLMQESSKINAKLAAAMKEIEELKSKTNFLAGFGYSKSHELQKDDSEAKMKDIQLDHILDSSYYENGSNSDVKDGRPSFDVDDQMLELWAMAERNGNSCSTKSSPELAPVVALIQMESHQNEAEGEERFSKVMLANKQEATRGGPRPQQEGSERAMERLASDGQRLVNLQASVEALKKQIASVDRNRQLSGSAYDRLKRQLEVTEQAVFESTDMNSKLTKGAAAEGLSEMEYSSRRQISEQAQKCSQKIGRLEFEVQRIQYVLLKLEDEFDNKMRKSVERSAGFSLKEYIYGAADGHKKEKRRFCACARPSTKE